MSFWKSIPLSVVRWSFHGVDHENRERAFGGLQAESQLFLKGGR